MVCWGQISAQRPQPMQRAGAIFGRGATHFSTAGTAQRTARGAESEKFILRQESGRRKFSTGANSAVSPAARAGSKAAGQSPRRPAAAR